MSLQSIIESLLFVHGEPISRARLADITGASAGDVDAALAEIRNDFHGRGIILIEKDGHCQFGTHPDNADSVAALLKSELAGPLSRATLDTVSIVAYKGPLTRLAIENIRGVNSAMALRNLHLRGLIERIPNPTDGRMPLYQITMDFMTHFGLTRIEDLPSYQEFRAQTEEHDDENATATDGVVPDTGAIQTV